MNTHKLSTTFTEDGQLVLTGLPFHAGDTVEIILVEQLREQKSSQSTNQSTKSEYPLQGTVLGYDDPFEPAVSAEDWQVLK